MNKLTTLPSQSTSRSARAVTLIEVLVVVFISILLLAVAVPLYLSAQKNAKMLTCQDNMANIYQAEETYRIRNRTYGTLAQIGGAWKCPSGTADYTIATSGSGSTLALTITCPNSGAHATNKMTTSDGTTFTFVP